MSLAPAADFLILDADGRSAVTVEATVAPPPWVDGWGAVEAALLEAADEDRTRFAVLVTLDRLKVWERAAGGGWDATAEADAGPLVRPMVERSGLPMKMVDGPMLESGLSTTFLILCSGRAARVGGDFARAAAHLRSFCPRFAEVLPGDRLLTGLQEEFDAATAPGRFG